MESEIVFRNMTEQDVKQVHDIWRSVSFDLGCHSLEIMLKLKPQDLWVASRGARVLGSFSCLSMGGEYSFVGLYAVDPKHSGKGIGSRLWEQGMEGHKTETLGLFTGKMASVYRDKCGFQNIYTSQFQKLVGFMSAPISTPSNPGVNVREVVGSSLKDVADYDAKVLGYSRLEWLRLTISKPDVISLAAHDRDDGRLIQGYLLSFKSITGRRAICPLYAVNDLVAETLMSALSDRIGPEEELVIYSPNDCSLISRIADKFNWTQITDSIQLMFTKSVSCCDFSSVYGFSDGNFFHV